MTTTDLARQGNHSIEQAKPRRELTLDQVVELTGYELPQIALISKTVAVGAPLHELAMFLHSCKTLGLDPILRQAYWIRRKSRALIDGKWQDEWKGALQVGIDGFRSIAERSGAYAGSEPPQFNGYLDVVGKDGEPIVVPERCRVVVWKIVAGHKAAFTGEANWIEFYPGPGNDGFMYRKMPRHMLAKDAEAQALRKAFPALLGAIQMVSETGEMPGGELPEVAAPERIIEQPAPSRPKPTAADYDRMAGSEDGGTFFDGPDQHTPPAPTAPKGKAKEQMLTVHSREYEEYATLCETAQALEVDYEALTAPVAASVLAERHAALSEAVRAARDAAAQQESLV